MNIIKTLATILTLAITASLFNSIPAQAINSNSLEYQLASRIVDEPGDELSEEDKYPEPDVVILEDDDTSNDEHIESPADEDVEDDEYNAGEHNPFAEDDD